MLKRSAQRGRHGAKDATYEAEKSHGKERETPNLKGKHWNTFNRVRGRRRAKMVALRSETDQKKSPNDISKKKAKKLIYRTRRAKGRGIHRDTPAREVCEASDKDKWWKGYIRQ